MTSKHTVVSYHLNIDEGDGAIHLLLDKDRLVESAVLIDGGLGTNGAKLIPEFMQSKQFRQWKRSAGKHAGQSISYFDAVVVTHWDDDHAAGLSSLFSKNIEAAAQEYIKNHNITTKLQFEAAVKGGNVQGSLINFSTTIKEGAYWPVTRFYCPYWNRSESNLYGHAKWGYTLTKVPSEGLIRWIEPDKKNDFLTFTISYKLPNGTKRTLKLVPGLRLAEMGKDLIGIDIFTGKRVIDPNAATYPSEISSRMASLNEWKQKPAMVCIGNDGVVCDPDSTEERARKRWADASGTTYLGGMKFHQLRLVSTNNTSVAETAGHHNDFSTQAVNGTTTGNNLASIACMIFWPSIERENVSHYFAGDLGDEIEENIIKWATFPNPQTQVLEPIRVGAMKLSHHGMVLYP